MPHILTYIIVTFQATQDFLDEHDIVVQDLIRKAREDLVWGKSILVLIQYFFL